MASYRGKEASASYFHMLRTSFEQMQYDAGGQKLSQEAFFQQLIHRFLKKRTEGHTVYFIGNGGSAGIAMHMTNDFLKNGRMKTHSMHDAATVTCLGNDYSYDDIFSKQLERVACAGDLLVAISSSGNSENIVRAIHSARKKQCEVLTLSGFDADNRIHSLGDWNLYIPCHVYGIVESLHNMVLQRIVDGMIEQIGSDEPEVHVAENRRIDFIVEHVTGRASKMLGAFLQRGYHVRLYFVPWKPEASEILQVMYHSGAEIVECQDANDLFRHLLATDAFVIHHFIRWGNAALAQAILEAWPHRKPRYVVENYDVQTGMFPGFPVESLRMERFAFEHADGVVFREFCGEYLEREKGFLFRHPTFTFLDYNLEEGVQNFPRRKKDEPLSLVYAGGLVTEEEYPTMSQACWDEVAALCEAHHCHLHVYPSADPARSTEPFKKYIERSVRSKYFHFHRTVPFETLYETLAKYDYGIFPARNDIYTLERNGMFFKAKNIYSSTNKFFDYVAAGLPIVAPTPMKLVEYFSTHGAAVLPWTNEKIDFDYLLQNREALRKQTLSARKFFTLDAHMDELIAFYRSL